FLHALYADVLHRSIDAAGDQAWGAALGSGVSAQVIAGDILRSSEAQQDLVGNYYHMFLHRAADTAGLGGFVSAMQNGAREDQVVANIVGSAEYYALA